MGWPKATTRRDEKRYFFVFDAANIRNLKLLIYCDWSYCHRDTHGNRLIAQLSVKSHKKILINLSKQNANFVCISFCNVIHDDVIKWKHLPCYWPFVRWIHRWNTLTIASDAELLCFLWSGPGKTVEQTLETSVIWNAIALMVMSLWCPHCYQSVLLYSGR